MRHSRLLRRLVEVSGCKKSPVLFLSPKICHGRDFADENVPRPKMQIPNDMGYAAAFKDSEGNICGVWGLHDKTPS